MKKVTILFLVICCSIIQNFTCQASSLKSEWDSVEDQQRKHQNFIQIKDEQFQKYLGLAKKGDKIAQYQVGTCFESSQGTSRDFVRKGYCNISFDCLKFKLQEPV